MFRLQKFTFQIKLKSPRFGRRGKTKPENGWVGKVWGNSAKSPLFCPVMEFVISLTYIVSCTLLNVVIYTSNYEKSIKHRTDW